MAKTKDIFLNIAANPNMTLEDLASVGLTSENTMLLDRALYASNEKVQNMFKDEEGNFDEQKFNTFYDIAEQSYNILANDEVNLNLMDVTAYDVDNIFVDPSKRRIENKPYIVKLPNPDRLNVGVTRIGKIGPRTLSLDEIAQTLQVLLNPVDVANGADPVYGDSPNDSWFTDFFDTRVMAAWDEDGTHIDPVTGRETIHKKGDLKLNENGTYYYENLDGRSVYGKRILNKFNTLTTDGSAWNKYDFFDSDSIELKSIGGSIAKNLALVGSMFIPYVGWGVAAASVVHQSAGLFAVLGKMLAGADNPTLNAIEGWVKSTDRKNLKTEYAQQNMWCWENFIDLIGDTTAQLREQRAIFKFAPGLIKGDFRALNDKATNKMAEKIIKDSMENVTDKSFKEIAKIAQKQNPGNWKKQLEFLMKESQGVFSAKAEKAVRDYVQSYYKLGEPIAKAYMTAITVQDTFGEAIEAGASNGEATMLTLGYAAAEAALLSTDLGKWIMPELRTERQRYKMIAKKLLELPKETRDLAKQIGRLTGETKKAWAKRLFNIGKDIANAEYSTMTKTVGSVLATGLGEGVEEVSEEALADFSKSCFNLVLQLLGDDVRLNAWNHNWNWNEALNRYGMSFAGGIMGGSINAAASDYKVNKDLLNMDSQKAMQQLVYMTRNNELDDFWKVINKTNLASKELSTLLNEDGIGYKQGTETDNLDLAAKRALRKLVDLINSIINAENAKLDDSGLLAALINADPALKDLDPVKEYRMRALSNSVTAGRFLNEWNTTISDIVKTQLDINNITSKYSDNKDISEEDERLIKLKKEDLKTLQKRKDAMLNGERTREYVRDALFEMSHAINETFNELSSEVRYAEAKTGKKYNDISEKEKKELHDKYELIMNSNQKAERIHELAEIYEHMATTASDGIVKSIKYYEDIKNNTHKNINELNYITTQRLDVLKRLIEDLDNGIIEILNILNDSYKDDLVVFQNDPALFLLIENIHNLTTLNIEAIRAGRTDDLLSNIEAEEINKLKHKGISDINNLILESVYTKVDTTIDEILKIGFAHPEIKNQLQNMIEALKNYSYNRLGELEQLWDIDEEYDKIELLYQLLHEKHQKIKELPNTPIIENLRLLQLATNIDNTVIDLVESLITKENKESSDISIFLLENTTLEQFKQAKDLLTLYRSAIVGARYDNIDLDNIVGFNTTLNELSGKQENPKLAEIDALTADLILEDINLLLKRLDYSEGLHNLNTGNKYNVLNKTALNKQFILYHKLKTFVSVLGDDDEWKGDELTELKTLLERESILKQFAGDGNYNTRDFTLNPELKILAEKESLDILHALHKFLNKHIDGNEASINKLAKLLTYNNFKGLIRENNEFLSQDSLDIDDSAFIWWLCATAALDPHQFYNNYRHILGLEKEGEKPIAPISTQELGTFALTAAVVNEDMFKTFGKALRKSLNEFWENAGESERDKIRQLYGENLLYQDSDKLYFKNNDFLPNFDNIIFVEGIAGSGKSTGVLKSWSKLLAKTNPDFIQQKIIFAHTDKEKAKGLAETTEFTNFEAHDHDSLLSYMSSKYKPTSEYVLDTDVELVEGIFRAKNWDLNVYNHDDVPKTIVIDEWSHYDQLEQELIQRFASTYGVTVIALGDYDLLTASAKIVEKPGDKDAKFDITPTRNMTARVAKLGVSMRTDNEIKNGNMYRMLAWKQNPTSSINLHYYEDNTGIYGDKNYRVGNSYGSTLDSIKKDVQKMISTLKDGQKIGYIYHNVDSELYKWIMSDPEIKKHILEYQEKDAHGREALYYIVENNRSKGLDAKDYFSSVYTGITRSELGSIVITSEYVVQNSSINNRHNKEGISFKTVLDTAMLPNTYTDEGTRNFTKNRINTFNEIYGNTEVTAFDIKPRTRQAIPTPSSSTPSTPTPSSNPSPNPIPSTPAPSTPTPSPSSSNGTDSGSTSTENPSNTTSSTNTSVSNPAANSSTLDPEREPESNDSWGGSLPKGQKLYDDHGRLFGVIEDWGEGEGPLDGFKVYKIRKAEDGSLVSIPEVAVDMDFLLKIPSSKPLYNINQLFVDSENSIWTIKDIIVNAHNNAWVYELTAPNRPPWTVNEYILWDSLSKNIVKEYIEPSEEEIPSEEPYLDNLLDFEEEIDEEFSEEEPSAIAENGLDIDFTLYGFTFNNYHLGAEFDKDGNIILELTDANRIDSGVGLHNIDPVKFKSKDYIKEVLGGIRQHLEFSSNANILKHILEVIGKTGLKIKWAFISKNSEDNNGKYSRYNIPRGTVEYMGKEDPNIQLKTISAIIYDNTGLAILELPIITLQSPHSVMGELIKKGIGLDITREWANYNPQNSSPTLYETLNKILEIIDTNHANHSGYLELKGLIQLWLFTGNGFKLLPENWNLSLDAENIGNLYITYKEAYSRKEDNYEGVWSDIIDPKTNERYRKDDRFISSIFMNNNKTNTYYDSGSKNYYRTFRSYTPYVLMSDDPEIITDEKAIKQYKKQLADPKEPKKVKLIPVSPPLVSVTTYIEAMERVRTHKSTNEPYGNAFTPYRIFDAILKSSEKDTILAPLSEKDKKYIERYIKELNEIVANNPIQTVPKQETNIEYKKRIAGLQRKILISKDSDGIIVFEKLRGLLTEGIVYYPQVGTDERGNKDILNLILKVCDNAGITGILAKPYFESDTLIGGFTYKVRVDSSNKYKFPGHGSFRIFGKIDPPTYNLKSLKSVIKELAKDASFGLDYYKNGQLVHVDVWHFRDKTDENNYYLPQDPTNTSLTNLSKKNTNTFNPENVRNLYRPLLARLGLDELNIDITPLQNSNTELEALLNIVKNINQEYLKTPGAFIIQINNKYKYGSIINLNTPEEYKNYKYKKYTIEDGAYKLHFDDMDNGGEKVIEITLDNNNNFEFIPENTLNNLGDLDVLVKTVADILKEVENDFKNDPFLSSDSSISELIYGTETKKGILSYYDIDNNIIDKIEIQNILDASGIDPLSRITLETILQLDVEDNVRDSDNTQILCINPIKIQFK